MPTFDEQVAALLTALREELAGLRQDVADVRREVKAVVRARGLIG